MTTMGNLFDEEEVRLLAQAKADIAAETQRYRSDPVYRAKIDAEREAKFAALPDMVAEDGEDEETP